MFLNKKQFPYSYVKEIVVYDAAWFRDEKKSSFLGKVANIIWSDAAYKVVGCWLLVVGLGGALTFSWPMVNSYISFNLEKTGKFLVEFSGKSNKNTQVIAVEEKPKLVFENKDFYIEIEKIGLNSVVLPNIDATAPVIYIEALKKGLAHSKGSSLPGEGKAIYIFGHSTNYEWFVASLNAVFYKLKDLKDDDTIVLKQDDRILSYKVFKKEIVEAEDTEILIENKDKDVLILQTCYPPGTNLKRLLVLAKPVK